MRNELPDVEHRAGHVAEVGANMLQQYVRRHRLILGEVETDIELAEVRRLRIIVEFTAAGTLVDQDDLRILEQVFPHQFAQAH